MTPDERDIHDWLFDREGEEDDYDDELDTRPEEEDEPLEEYTDQYVWGMMMTKYILTLVILCASYTFFPDTRDWYRLDFQWPHVQEARAGVVCQTIGHFTYCTDDTTGQTVTCQRIGQFVYCN